MGRIISLTLLITVILLMTGVFLLVVGQFLLPMFLALLLVVLFRPVHEWIKQRCRGHDSLAAGLTTFAILVIVLLPTLGIASRAALEGARIIRTVDQEEFRHRVMANGGHLMGQLRAWGADVGLQIPTDRELFQAIFKNFEGLVAPAAWSTTRYLGNFIIGLLVMLVALYFFLVDGSTMVRATLRLIPMDNRYLEQLLEEFVKVTRAVVSATLIAAGSQGLLAGVGYWCADLRPAFMLTVLTMFLAMVPFVGAVVVWVPCCLYLYFYEQRTLAAVLLTLWCVCVVSLVDNLIKPYILHGQSNLHPLLALLSVLGGVKALGPIGIFVGPMVVAFLQALLNILRTEIEGIDQKGSVA